MLRIRCPWCGDRDEVEFGYGGQAGVRYPADPANRGDQDWGEYLFMRDNPAGPLTEQWVHTHGCRRWFELTRDTTTNEILAERPGK